MVEIQQLRADLRLAQRRLTAIKLQIALDRLDALQLQIGVVEACERQPNRGPAMQRGNALLWGAGEALFDLDADTARARIRAAAVAYAEKSDGHGRDRGRHPRQLAQLR